MPRTTRLRRVALRVALHRAIHRHGDSVGVLLASFLVLFLTVLTTTVTIRPQLASFDPKTGVVSATYSLEQQPTFFVDTNGIAASAGSRVTAKVIASDGKLLVTKPIVSLQPGRADAYTITLPLETRPVPGKYTVEVSVHSGVTSRTVSQDFTWGVLALNMNRSSYQKDEKVTVGMAVLDDRGVTLCDSSLLLEILTPNKKVMQFSTQNKTVSLSKTCADKTVTNAPDYSTVYVPEEEGEYSVRLVASTKNGVREAWSSFVVTDDVAFVSERVETAMRLYPAASYEVTARLYAKKEFTGQFEERVPHSFSITEPKLELRKANGSRSQVTNDTLRIDVEGDNRFMRWEGLVLQKGDELELTYTYKPPFISPAFYQLGPLKLSDGKGNVAFKEPHAWQLASDAAGDVIVLWDTADGAVPAGWTCVSCTAGDAFYQLFPLGNSTYAGTGGGPESVTHTYAQTAVSSPTPLTGNISTVLASRAIPTNTHGHTFPAPVIGSTDIKPPYKNLKFIKASNPLSLPLDAIAMFDVAAVGSLPTNWASYTALNDPAATGTAGNGVYLRGENTNTTGGVATHSHTRAASTSGGPSATVNIAANNNITLNGVAHTHTLAVGNTTTVNNDPSFISVVFAKVSVANEALPNGMLAFFDSTTMPTGWTQQTTIGGNALANKLIKGTINSTAAGSSGGVTTHNHGASQVITSGVPSTTIQGGNAGLTNTTSGTTASTHNATFSISAGSTMPNYRSVIIGKFATVNITGTVYSDEGTTALGSQAVKIALNGSGQRTTTTAANGTYTLAMPDPGPGGVFTVWLNTNGGAMGTTVTRSNGGAISGVDIYQNRLVTTHEDSGPLSNINLGTCDKTSGTTGVCVDTDLHFDEASSNLTVDNDWRVYIKGGKTFTPGGTVTLSPGGTAASVGGDIKWGSATSTLNVSTNALNVGGDWINTAGGNFTKASGQTTTMTGTVTGLTVDASTKNFEKLTFNGTAGAWAFTPAATAVNVDNDFAITTGTVTAPSGTLSVGGNWTNGATYTHNSGTVAFTSTATGKTVNPGSSSFSNVTFNGSGGAWSPLTNTLTALGDLTMTAGTLDNSSGSASVVVNGHVQGTAGVINLSNNTFTQRVASAKNFGATSGSAGWNFNNLIFSNSSGSAATITTQTGGSGIITTSGTLTVSNTGDTAGTALGAGNRTWRLTNANHANPFNLDLAGGLLTGNSSTFEYTGDNDSGDVTIENGSYFNLTLGGAAADNYTPEGALTVGGSLLINANATLTGTQDVTVNGNASGAGAISLTGGIFTQRVAANQNFGTTSGSNDWVFQQLRFENSSGIDRTVTINGTGSGVIRTNGLLTVGNSTDTNVTILDNETNDRVLDVNDNFTISSRGSYLASSTNVLTLAGNYLNDGSLTAGTGEVVFDAGAGGRTIVTGGTGSTKQFNKVTFNNGSGGWTISTDDMKAVSDLTVTNIGTLTLASGRTLEVGGTYSICDTCTSKTTWTGSTLYLNSGTAYTVGSKTQDAESYGTLQVGVNTDIRTWRSSAATATTVASSGSLYSQDHAVVDGVLNIYGDYHVTNDDYWSYSTDFDGAALVGAAQRQAVVRIETGSGRGVTVDTTKTLNVTGGGTGTLQFSDIERIGGAGQYHLVNSGTANVQEAKIFNASFDGGTWPVLNTIVSEQTVTAGMLTTDWYLAPQVADRDTLAAINTAGADMTVSETTGSPAATVFKRASGVWGSGATSQTADSGADGRIAQPNSDTALRIREYSQTSGGSTYYQYNLSIAAQTAHATYDYKRDYGKYITSTGNTGSSENQVIGAAWYRDTIGTENTAPAINGSVTSGTWYAGMSIGLLALWDSGDGAVPSGWSCVSCSGGDPFYQRFLRGAATYGGTGGGTESHGHNLSSPSAGSGGTFSALTGATNVASGAHTHSWDFGGGDDTNNGDSKPPYQNVKVIRGPVSGPLAWPANIIMPFKTTTAPTSWTAYAGLDGRYARGENTNTTGGASTHTHDSNPLSSGAASGTVGTTCVTGCVSAASTGHTHSLASTALTAANNDPLHINVRFMKHNDTSVPPRQHMLALFDHTSMPEFYELASNAAPYQGNLLVGATSGMESAGGSATHNHGGSLLITSSAQIEAVASAATSSSSAATGSHTHRVTYTVDAASAMPLYRDVVVAKYVPNLDPDTPTALAQKKTSDVVITSAGWINETSVKFTVTASDPDPDTQQLQLCVEKKDTGTAFVGTEDLCGTAVAETGASTVNLSVTITGLTPDEYYWQVRVKDQDDAYSSWVYYDTADINTRDFGIDTSAPTTAAVYDNTNIDSQPLNTDRDQNADGSLTTLSVTWEDFDASTSGLAKYEYSIGTSAGATDTKAWTDNGTARFKRDTSLSLQTNKIYYFNVRATDNAGNVSSAVSSNGQIVTPTLTFDIDVDASDTETSPPYAIDFGSLTAASVANSPKKIWIDFDTNGVAGGRVYVAGLNDGLRSTAANFTIASSTSNLGTAPSGFGAQGSSATQGGGGPFVISSPYDGSSDNVGALNTTFQSIFSTGNPVTAGRGSFLLKVKPSSLTPASNDYSETLIIIAAGTY